MKKVMNVNIMQNVQIKQKIVLIVKMKQVHVMNVKMNVYYQIQNVIIIHYLKNVNQKKITNVQNVHFGINQIQMEHIVNHMLYGG